MAKYRVRASCEVLSRWRTPNEIFELTDEQALMLRPPHGDVIIPVVVVLKQTAKKEPANGKLKRS